MNYNKIKTDKGRICSRAGFTMVELLVVFAIFFITTTAGAVAFNQYNTSRRVESSSKDFISFINSARTNAVTQTMLGSCTQQFQLTQQLKKYSVHITSQSTYEMLVYCADSNNIITSTSLKQQKLPDNVNFYTGTYQEIAFEPGTGKLVDNLDKWVTIVGNNVTKTIHIDPMGNITGQ